MSQAVSIVGANERNIGTEDRRETSRASQRFEVQRDGHAGVGFAVLDLAEVSPTPEAHNASHRVERHSEVTAKFGERGHAEKFAYAEQTGKSFVRHDRTDTVGECSHIPNVAEKARKTRHDLYAAYRERSGWWLAAWRDFAGLTLEDLAAELGRSKGYVSDLETGAPRPGRPPTRFNRDLIDQVAKVVGTTGGRLIDVNPFELSERMERLSAAVAKLDEAGQDAVLDMAERWLARSAS
jgi:transcriptional regulator with XRE-family HTH domain